MQLAQLEREAGVKLLRRVGRNVEPTRPRAARRPCGPAVAADEAIRAELARARGSPRGRLRMTFVQMPALAAARGARPARGSRPRPPGRSGSARDAPGVEDRRSRAVDLVLGIEYDPVPVPRRRDVDRRDLIREHALLAAPEHLALSRRTGRAWRPARARRGRPGAAGPATARRSGDVCNRLGGYAPNIRHRSDDGLILRALVASGRAVTLLPALLATAMPQVSARRLHEERLQRTIFTATRTTTPRRPPSWPCARHSATPRGVRPPGSETSRFSTPVAEVVADAMFDRGIDAWVGRGQDAPSTPRVLFCCWERLARRIDGGRETVQFHTRNPLEFLYERSSQSPPGPTTSGSNGQHRAQPRPSARRTETKAAFKTTELIGTSSP